MFMQSNEIARMNKVKSGKSRHSPNVESESDESNHQLPNLDLSLMRQPIATSVTGFEEVLRAYEAGTNEVSRLKSFKIFLPLSKFSFPNSYVNCLLANAI